MKIYQIHKSGGEWEYRYDIIVGSYSKLRKAEVEFQKMKIEEDNRIIRALKCNECPLFRETWAEPDEQTIEMAKRYCSYYEDEGDRYCSNYEGDLDQACFYIHEVEVIE